MISPQVVFGLLVSGGVFACIFWMLMWGFPTENKDALNSLLGVLTTVFTLIMNFFFGSTASSKAKDDTIGAIATTTAATAGTGSTTLIPNATSVAVDNTNGTVNLNDKEKEDEVKKSTSTDPASTDSLRNADDSKPDDLSGGK
jgi:hypothetical protein